MIIIPSKNNYGFEKKPVKEFSQITYNPVTYADQKRLNQKLTNDITFENYHNKSLTYPFSMSGSYKGQFQYQKASHLIGESETTETVKFPIKDSNVISYTVDEVIKRETKPTILITVKRGKINTSLDEYDWDDAEINEELTETKTIYSFDFKEQMTDDYYIEGNSEQISVISPNETIVILGENSYYEGLNGYPNSWLTYGETSNPTAYMAIKIELLCTITSLVEYNYLSVELAYQSTMTFDMDANITVLEKSSSESTIGSSSTREDVSFGQNPFIQTNSRYNGKPISEFLTDKIFPQSQIDTLDLKCSIGDYYDENGNLIIAKNGSTNKIAFEKYDEVCLYRRTQQGFDEPMFLNDSGFTQSFSVVGCNFKYGGSILQNLKLQEKRLIPYGTPGLSFVLENGYYVCNGIGTATSTDIVIPKSYNGVNVLGIAPHAFTMNYNIKNLIICQGVQSIGYNAFGICNKLKSVIIGDGALHIGNAAFNNCEELVTVTIPNTLTTIGDEAFIACTNLSTINFDGTIQQWYNISKGIDWDADIEYYKIYCTNGVIYPPSQGLDLQINTDGASYSVNGIGTCTETDIVIPDVYNNLPVTKIYDYAFTSNNSITSIIVGNNVTYIGDYAFEACLSLTNITIQSSVTRIGRAFGNTLKLTNVYITDLAKWCSISFTLHDANPLFYANNLYINGNLLTKLVIPESVTSISKYAFFRGVQFSEITIPNSVTSIGNSAFANCYNITDVYYKGTEAEWNALVVNIGSSNDYLLNATIHFNS